MERRRSTRLLHQQARRRDVSTLAAGDDRSMIGSGPLQVGERGQLDDQLPSAA